MARKSSLLGPAVDRHRTAADSQIAVSSEQERALTAPTRTSSNAGKYHLGGYFEQDDPVAEAFRVLAARTRRRQQDLLAEAIADIVAKYDAKGKFGTTA